MGIYDRDYYRDDTRWSNPFGRSQGTLFLVLLSAFLFLLQVAGADIRPAVQDPLTRTLELDVSGVVGGEVWRVVTYAFVHLGIFHIIFTVIFLVWIGRQVEDLYGSKEYLGFFLVSTLIGGVAYTAVGAVTPAVPPLVGPSGAVTAVLVLFALHYPTRTILYRFFIPIRVWLLVVIYAVVDVFGLAGGHRNPPAVAVHLAGAAFAFVYHTYTLRVLNWLPRGSSRGATRPKPRSQPRARRDERQPEPAAAASATGAATALAVGPAAVDEHLEAKLDEVLEKVQQHGKESLTEGEREILLRASEIYKKRRRPG